jgi:two-component system response regulator (stage 0 sporulation protein F)
VIFIVATILVIDDEKKQCDLLQDILSRAGYDVLCQFSAAKIVSLLNQIRPDLLIIDIFMPGTDGLEAILEIRKAGLKLPVIALSEAFRQDANFLDIATDLGANSTFEKPLDKQRLLQAVRNLLPSNEVASDFFASVQLPRARNSQG